MRTLNPVPTMRPFGDPLPVQRTQSDVTLWGIKWHCEWAGDMLIRVQIKGRWLDAGDALSQGLRWALESQHMEQAA